MRRTLIAILSAATTVAALGVSGCADRQQAAPLNPAAPTLNGPALSAPTQAPPPADLGPLPPPEALGDVLYRLADPNVPGAEKLGLVEDTAPADSGTLDGFASALRDGGFSPITVKASDIRWSDSHPGDVLATVAITGPTDSDGPGEFVFPMEFSRRGDGWQMTRETADMLLAFGNARTGVITPESPPPPGPTPPP